MWYSYYTSYIKLARVHNIVTILLLYIKHNDLNISDCPVGFNVKSYGFGYFGKLKPAFSAISFVSGIISYTHEEIRSCLSLNGDRVEFAMLCLPI